MDYSLIFLTLASGAWAYVNRNSFKTQFMTYIFKALCTAYLFSEKEGIFSVLKSGLREMGGFLKDNFGSPTPPASPEVDGYVVGESSLRSDVKNLQNLIEKQKNGVSPMPSPVVNQRT